MRIQDIHVGDAFIRTGDHSGTDTVMSVQEKWLTVLALNGVTCEWGQADVDAAMSMGWKFVRWVHLTVRVPAGI